MIDMGISWKTTWFSGDLHNETYGDLDCHLDSGLYDWRGACWWLKWEFTGNMWFQDVYGGFVVTCGILMAQMGKGLKWRMVGL